MNNGLFSLLKWLYEHPEALKRRFLPVVIALLFSVGYQLFGISRFIAELAQSWVLGGQLLILAGLWCYAGVLLPKDRSFFKRIERLINEMRNQEAEDLLRRRPVFMGEAGDVARQIYLVRVLANRNSVEAAYTLLGDIRRLSLLPKEKQQFRMATARVMYVSGNYERFEACGTYSGQHMPSRPCLTGLRKAWDRRGRFRELRSRDCEGPLRDESSESGRVRIVKMRGALSITPSGKVLGLCRIV